MCSMVKIVEWWSYVGVSGGNSAVEGETLVPQSGSQYLYSMMHEAHGLRTNGAFVVVFVVEGIFSKYCPSMSTRTKI